MSDHPFDARPSGEQRKGAFYGLLAASTFGISAPIAKRLLGEVSPTVLAGLLYLGAGIGLTAFRVLRRSRTESPLTKADLPMLSAVIAAGGIVGPLLMLLGLERTSAVTGSLLLNLEAPLTIAMAVLVFREHLERRAAGGIALVLTGAVILRIEVGGQTTSGAGMLLLAGACAAWALDNNLTQRLSLRDPIALVQTKTLGAGAFNLAIGLVVANGRLPAFPVLLAAMALGSVSYGASVVLDTYALRLVGAAREAAFFATAPFFGAVAATFIVGERLTWTDGLAMIVMAGGAWLLLRERHSHEHVHEEIEHAHVHTHDEHHRHPHDADAPPGEPHAHRHKHARLVHDHPHASDLHHRHRHARSDE
jgi:drug/metabolite transporter (DMT)-like permease